MNLLSRIVGRWLGRYLSQPSRNPSTGTPTDPARLAACLQPGDVLLVEGVSRVSTAIKYLTQSTWSHAALYVGPLPQHAVADGPVPCFIEADIVKGVRTVGLTEFAGLHTRICRPVGLARADIEHLRAFALEHLGQQYDLKNIVDLARYLFPTPPVPVRWRRRMLALGSGDPTRAICSTLVAQCFQRVHYPILPDISHMPANDPMCEGCVREVLHIRHHSLFTPRDFDVSPYFQIIKPTLLTDFDPRTVAWADQPATPVT